jgi:hypothetical protein
MPVTLVSMRTLLLPGLWEMAGTYETLTQWHGLLVPEAPHIWVPKVPLPAAVGLVAATAIIKNPEITRRFWSGWR